MASRTRSAEPDLNAVVRALYGALSEDTSFRGCLEVVGSALRCHVSGLHFEDFGGQQSRIEIVGSVGRDELMKLTRDYADRWQGKNTWLQRSISVLVDTGYSDGDAVVKEAELFAMPYYRYFLNRIDIRHGLAICLWHNGPRKLVLASFNRAPAEGAFTSESMAFVAALRPHMVNAFAIYRRTALLDETNYCLRAALDRAPMGMMVLGAEGQVLHANDEADRLLGTSTGIARSRTGGLVFDRNAENSQFLRLLRLLTSDTSGELTRSILIMRSGRFALPRLVLHLCALPPRTAAMPAGRVIAFLCPLTRADFERLDSAMLQTVLGLTPSELRVLMELRHHYDVKVAADALHVAPTTVRTHLKHAFEKTNTHKQAELLALVDRVMTLAPVGTGAQQSDISGPDPFPS